MEEKRHGGKGGSNNGGNIKKNNKNIIKKLQDREICSKPHRAFVAATVPHRFQNLRLSHQLDTHDPKHKFTTSLFRPFSIMGRTKIVEIVAAKSIVFVLSDSGLCAAFRSETDERICLMNVYLGEIITSLFYNKNNDSLITVSLYASDNFSSWKFRSTSIESIRRAKPDAGFHLFQSGSIKWPGYVKFDDINAKVLTYSAQDSVYKVFELKNYTLLYSFSFRNVEEIKISPGIMLLIFKRETDCIPMKIISIEDGIVLKTFGYRHWNTKVDFIEHCNEKLLVKQDNAILQILDLPRSKGMVVSRTEFMSPSLFIFLIENQLFLTLKNGTISVWNYRGELVTSLEDHLLWHPLWHPHFSMKNNYITSDQNLIISYCKADSEDQSMETNAVGSINVSNILSGKCVAKINAAKALEGITALYYDEDRNEIYTGNRHGLVHVWSNRLMKKKN